LGAGGLIPFAATSIAATYLGGTVGMIAMQAQVRHPLYRPDPHPRSSIDCFYLFELLYNSHVWQIAWGASILSFLGGPHWAWGSVGFTRDSRPPTVEKEEWKRLSLSVLPSFVSFGAILTMSSPIIGEFICTPLKLYGKFQSTLPVVASFYIKFYV
jgi:hypothetical protein